MSQLHPTDPAKLKDGSSSDESKGKGIVTKDNPLKELIPLMDEGRLAPKMINLKQFSTSGIQMSIEKAKAQLEEMKRLATLKVEKEKSEKKLKKVMKPTKIQAQAQRLAEYEAKRAKMLEEYSYYITHRADKLPITKISYRINNVSKEATMRIKRNNQPLTLIVYEKFVLKTLGFIEWIDIHALAFKNKTK
nr:hypothetical protein [Tanacetum cinerariifolium]